MYGCSVHPVFNKRNKPSFDQRDEQNNYNPTLFEDFSEEVPNLSISLTYFTQDKQVVVMSNKHETSILGLNYQIRIIVWGNVHSRTRPVPLALGYQLGVLGLHANSAMDDSSPIY